MNWGGLRVVNDDLITKDTSVPPHPHRSMEIITYVHGKNLHPETGKIEGGIGVQHSDNKDNKGSNGRINPGDIQVMSVGTEGIVHSEYPHKGGDGKSLCVFQLWILPDKRVKETTWGTKHFPRENTSNQFIYFASGFKDDQDAGAMPINSYSRVVGAHLENHKAVKYHLGKTRIAYAVAIRGSIKVKGIVAGSHDGIAIKETEELVFDSVDDDAEILLIDTHP